MFFYFVGDNCNVKAVKISANVDTDTGSKPLGTRQDLLATLDE